MQIPKPTDADKGYFRSILPADPDVVIKPMLGNLGAFVNGNMFAGLFGATVGVRLGDTDRIELEFIDGSGPFGPIERPMGGYVGLPLARQNDSDRAALWAEKAFVYVGSLPPKVAKPKRTK